MAGPRATVSFGSRPLVFRHLRTQSPSQRSLRNRFIRHSLYAWGVPLLMTLLLAFFNYAPTSVIPEGAIMRPGLGERKCFISGECRMLAQVCRGEARERASVDFVDSE